MQSRTRELFRFAAVGVVNTAVDLLVLNALIFATHSGTNGVRFSAFKAVSFVVALANSYVLNKYWTFRDSAVVRAPRKELGRFVAISLGGLVINNLAASTVALHPFGPAGVPALWPTVAGIAGAAAGLVWNYFGYRTFVFRPLDSGPHAPLT